NVTGVQTCALPISLDRADAGVELAIALLQPVDRLLNDEQTVVQLVQTRDRRAGMAFEGPHLRETFPFRFLCASPYLSAPRGGGCLGGGDHLCTTSTSRSTSGGVPIVTWSGGLRQYHTGQSARRAGSPGGG